MNLFESLLALTFVAAALLKLSNRFRIPYPSMLALAGVGVAALPFAPTVEISPDLALALFIPPALFDIAYDTSPRQLRRLWMPLVSLALMAVLLTTGVVAWLAWAMIGLPVAAAIVLGAIVAPPDAAAASAAMSQLGLPRRTLAVLEGESLLNDASALLIFGAAMSFVQAHGSSGSTLTHLLLAAPGGVAFGVVAGIAYRYLRRWFAGTLSARVVEFASTWAVWLVAERLELSAILAIVAFAMYLGQFTSERLSARDRLHSYSVWESVVFMLNVLAFLLMGLQARSVVAALQGPELLQGALIASLVLLAVIVVRILWVMTYALGVHSVIRCFSGPPQVPHPDWRLGLVISWSGMRGLVTLATALALPQEFPGRDIIILSAFVVVQGTLVLQGLTVGPLIRLLGIEPDHSLNRELSAARTMVTRAALDSLASESGEAAQALREEYRSKAAVASNDTQPQADTEFDRLRRRAIAAQREALLLLRRDEQVSEDVFYQLERELDCAELYATSLNDIAIKES